MSVKHKRRLAKLEAPLKARVMHFIYTPEGMSAETALKILGIELKENEYTFCMELLPPGSAPFIPP